MDGKYGMKVSAAVLTQVVLDWQAQFPELKRYKTGQRILKRIGPIVLGIELEKFLADEYRPLFIAYNLLDEDSKKAPAAIFQYIKDKKGFDVDIPYLRHEQSYLEACERVKEQALINLFGKPGLEQILDGIMSYIKRHATSVPFSPCQAVMQISGLLEDKAKAARYFEEALAIIGRDSIAAFANTDLKGTDKWIERMRQPPAGGMEGMEAAIEAGVKRFRFEDVLVY